MLGACRIHGQVSRRPAEWTPLPSLQEQLLQEVTYAKAVSEGVAKVLQPAVLYRDNLSSVVHS